MDRWHVFQTYCLFISKGIPVFSIVSIGIDNIRRIVILLDY